MNKERAPKPRHEQVRQARSSRGSEIMGDKEVFKHFDGGGGQELEMASKKEDEEMMARSRKQASAAGGGDAAARGEDPRDAAAQLSSTRPRQHATVPTASTASSPTRWASARRSRRSLSLLAARGKGFTGPSPRARAPSRRSPTGCASSSAGRRSSRCSTSTATRTSARADRGGPDADKSLRRVRHLVRDGHPRAEGLPQVRVALPRSSTRRTA